LSCPIVKNSAANSNRVFPVIKNSP
jgi:hypothetical protein